MKKTKLLTTLGAVALIGAIGVGSTFAYLSANTGTVRNTFTVGDVQFDETLGGGLTESEVVKDTDGDYVIKDENKKWTETEITYDDIVAGSNLYKDPTVHIAADSEDCWVFAKVVNTNAKLTINYCNDWEDVTDTYCRLKRLDPDELGYKVYAKVDKVEKNTTDVQHSTIFDSVDVAANVTGDDDFTPITIDACAVQAAGFETYLDALDAVSFE